MEPAINIRRRIRKSLLIEKIHQQEKYSKKLGIEDFSEFHGKRINRRF